jgi:hypothetical protein
MGLRRLRYESKKSLPHSRTTYKVVPCLAKTACRILLSKIEGTCDSHFKMFVSACLAQDLWRSLKVSVLPFQDIPGSTRGE